MTTPQTPVDALTPCPFCGQDLYTRRSAYNPKAHCITEGCKGAQLPVLNIDQPDDIAAWNRRAPEASARALAAMPAAEDIAYTPGQWFDATTVDLMEAFYRSRLPAIREAAHAHGYAIGVHGSMRRDLDLIAAPWREGASDADTLVEAIQKAACGFTQSKYQWEKKPAGRVAISVPICWTYRHGVLSDGHIDLSVLGVVSGVRQCPTCDGDGWTEEGDPEIGSAKGDCPTCKGAGCLATPSAPTAVEPDERAMANELIKVAAWLLSPEPRRKLAELEDATHIGHRQFHRAYEGTFETLRLKAIEIRNFVDAARASKGTP